MKINWKDIMLAIVFILVLLGIKNSKADMLQDYNSEVVEYIQTEYKILSEYTKFICKKGILYKSGRVQRKYTGKAQTCEVKLMTRGEYEEYTILTLF